MTDRVTPAVRSQNMARIRGKYTTPERYIFAVATAGGLRFIKHAKGVFGRPDLVFPTKRVAVFVDGDFWHGFRFPQWSRRMAEFWQKKIAGNRERDRRNFRRLRQAGWKVVRLWEHQVEADVLACVLRIADAVDAVDFDAVRAGAILMRMPPLKRRRRLPRP